MYLKRKAFQSLSRVLDLFLTRYQIVLSVINYEKMKYRFKSLLLLVVLSTCLISPFRLRALDESIKLSVGVASMDITPDARVKDWVTGKPYSKINDPLSVKTLILGDGESKIVIVAWDLVDAGESATDEV